jgi:glutathione S-transferase
MSDLTLYHCRDSRSLRPLWALEEMSIDCKLINLEFPPRYKTPDYLEINPLGTVPTLIDGSITLTESTAICHYLVDKYKNSTIGLSSDHPDYGIYLNWLHRSDTTFTFPQTLILRYSQYESPERQQPQVVEDYKKWFNNRIRSIESALENKMYLCANKFTIADICVGYALYLASMIHIDDKFGPNTQAYLARLTTRDGFKAANAKQMHLDNIF